MASMFRILDIGDLKCAWRVRLVFAQHRTMEVVCSMDFLQHLVRANTVS